MLKGLDRFAGALGILQPCQVAPSTRSSVNQNTAQVTHNASESVATKPAGCLIVATSGYTCRPDADQNLSPACTGLQARVS